MAPTVCATHPPCVPRLCLLPWAELPVPWGTSAAKTDMAWLAEVGRGALHWAQSL
jgi:hypothetical protein